MLPPAMQTPESVLRTYFRAKDENRPHLIGRAFTQGAVLEIRNKASSIEFPALTDGRDAIADVLARRFGQTFENVYTFYLARPPEAATAYRCDWLVVMSEKASRQVRVGCGRYDWTFDAAAGGLASRLVITIEAMQILPPVTWASISAWLERLAYPWSSAGAVLASAPALEGLAPVVAYLSREHNDAADPRNESGSRCG